MQEFFGETEAAKRLVFCAKAGKMRTAGWNGQPAVLGGKRMSQIRFLLVLRIRVWRRRVLHVVVSLSGA